MSWRWPRRHRDIQLKLALERDVRLVRFEEGAIEFSPAPGASPQLAQILMRRLQEWTGRRWIVAIAREEGAPSLKEVADEKARQAMNGVRADPLVRRALEVFRAPKSSRFAPPRRRRPLRRARTMSAPATKTSDLSTTAMPRLISEASEQR